MCKYDKMQYCNYSPAFYKAELGKCGSAVGITTTLSESQTRGRSEHGSWKQKRET